VVVGEPRPCLDGHLAYPIAALLCLETRLRFYPGG